MAAYETQSLNLTGQDDPDRLQCGRASEQFFPILGITAKIGREFASEEYKQGNGQVIIISHKLWQKRFASDPAALGKSMMLDGKPYTIVGILPSTFRFSEPADLWIPLPEIVPSKTKSQMVTVDLYNVIARMKPGVSIARAQSDLDVMLHRLEEGDSNRLFPPGSHAIVTRWQDKIVGEVRPALLVLFGSVGFVLLIACANVANLMLARSTARQKEIAIRSALGASRARLIRQMLTESISLALIGGLLGLFIAYMGSRFLSTIGSDGLYEGVANLVNIGIDMRVLVFTLGASIVTGIVFGLMPALGASKPDLIESIKAGSSKSSGKFGLRRTRGLLVVTELALALVLLIGAGLMMKSFVRLTDVKSGFNPDNVLSMRITLPHYKYPQSNQQMNFYQQLLQKVTALPGVKSAGISNNSAFKEISMEGTVQIEGSPDNSKERNGPYYFITTVSPDYFKTMEIPLRKGRLFSDYDREGAPEVAVINEAAAQKFFPDQDPIGKRIQFSLAKDWTPIVGVVGNAKRQDLSSDFPPEIYASSFQRVANSMSLLIRAESDPINMVAAVRSRILEIDPEQSVTGVRTVNDEMASAVAPQRFNLVLLGVFAAIALLMATMGIYGVMSYAVTQRTHEIGIRMALGARQSEVRKMIVSQGMAMALIGVGIGLLAAYGVTRVLSKMLYSVSVTDPGIFVGIAVLLIVVALLASYLPARRATKVDPLIALRHE